MSFVEHLEALRWHIIRMVLAILGGTIFAFVFIEDIFEKIVLAPTKASFPPYKLLCIAAKKFHYPNLCMADVAINFQNIKLSGQFMMSLTASLVIGLIIAFPYVAWELWRFIRPALTEKERKKSTGFVFWATVLFLFGVAFGYYIITPYTVNFFANYKISPQFENIIRIDDYLDTLLSLVLGTGLVFELPVFVYFLSKAGLVTPRFMKTYRRYAIVGVLVLAAVITPPDVISQIIVAIPIMLLYEASIMISARVEKKYLKEQRDLINS